ncbi:MAG: hypothetical protein C7B47_17710 [Sulfobacillus thermosulfidooxidans]|uniref:Uncharacterized protein n=1 Tax=Sulfobacillus thermosulfidooxidans TaxID=28034 RepID=A0A2T2WF46_SULTH|nr:MAG: hypothetical protein C7B47_17710 [Sulfobacillus thermosulfidooxidans]
MNEFRIAIDADSSSALVKMLDSYLYAWHLQGSDRAEELMLRLIPGETTQIQVSVLAGSALRQAVRIMSRAGSIPVRRTWTIRQRQLLVFQISPQNRAQASIFRTLAWALFLWAASRHPGHEAFHGFVQGSRGPTPMSAEPSGDSMASRGVFSRQTQPLSHPTHTTAFGHSTLQSNPPLENPQKKGG